MTTVSNSGSARGKKMLSALPELAAQWHPTKNGDLTPATVTQKSARDVWWLGSCGHEWQAKVFNVTNGQGCPFCSGRRVLAGFNDLATTHPEVAGEWDYEKNGEDFSPSSVSSGSHKRVWWKCVQGHSWEAGVGVRTKGNGCPYCANRKVLSGFNDLRTVFPALAEEWDAIKNVSLSPDEVMAKSTKKFWWKCRNDDEHTWRASPLERQRGSGCPYCANRMVSSGKNDLASQNPSLAAEWHPVKNGVLTPVDVVANSKRFVWWQCAVDAEHAWEARVSARSNGTGCPYCAKRAVLLGVSDLVTMQPDVAAQWHYEKNGGLKPEEVSVSSGVKVWWKCSVVPEHEWESWVYQRTRGSGCPHCHTAAVTSRAEREIGALVSSWGIDVVLNDRKVLDGKELDIYIPSKKLAVEFNGLYWHTEKWGKDKEYHRNKWQLCRDKGIQLIQVWEDDWRDRRMIVERALAHKLGVSQVARVPARKTIAVDVSKGEAQAFLSTHHIQGFVAGSYYFGLKTKNTDQLIAVMVLMKQGEDLVLSRFATSVIVPGGQSKLVKHVERTLVYKNLVTFADLEVSDGGLYEVTGFVKDKVLPPDYKYVYNGQRQHKFGFRLERFRKDDTLLYKEGLSERELAELNDIPRVWDSGKIRYVKSHPNRAVE